MTTTKTCVRDCLRDTDGKVVRKDRHTLTFYRLSRLPIVDYRSRTICSPCNSNCSCICILTFPYCNETICGESRIESRSVQPTLAVALSDASQQLHWMHTPVTELPRFSIIEMSLTLTSVYGKVCPQRFVDNALDNNKTSCRCLTNHLISDLHLL